MIGFWSCDIWFINNVICVSCWKIPIESFRITFRFHAFSPENVNKFLKIVNWIYTITIAYRLSIVISFTDHNLIFFSLVKYSLILHLEMFNALYWILNLYLYCTRIQLTMTTIFDGNKYKSFMLSYTQFKESFIFLFQWPFMCIDFDSMWINESSYVSVDCKHRELKYDRAVV